MPNIYEVARQARVSVATVSAVVNHSAYVSPQLERHVAAIKTLGYQANLPARSLAKQSSHRLGMIVPDIANPFWPEVVRGAEDCAHERATRCCLPTATTTPEKRKCTRPLHGRASRRHSVDEGSRRALG